MEEELRIPPDSAKNCLAVIDNERVKDVFKCFRDKVDVINAEDSSSKDDATHTKTRAQCHVQQGAVFSGKILSFGCSLCKDNCTFSPNDLLKHFRAAHEGALPTYPCDLCEFVTNEFTALQRHRIAHRNTLVTCELCHDDVQYSLLLLTRHYIMCHSVNGQFQCDWCDFTTMDAGTFVQHIHHHNERHWKCSKCRHISLNEEDHKKHVTAHSGTFPFTCPICGYGATKSEFLKKHTAIVHKEETERREAWKSSEDNSTSSLKVFLGKSGDSPEAPKLSRLNSLPNQSGKVPKSELSSEHTYHLTDGTFLKKDNKSKVCQSTELSTPITLQESESSPSLVAGSHTNANGLTVLMVKNKISLPAKCTTKVMGFKLVDGKKHLVLKVIPTASQELSSSNFPIVEGMCSAAAKDTLENADFSNNNLPSSHCVAVSPESISRIQIDQNDIMAVKVKIEEEETSISTSNAIRQIDGVEVPPSSSLNESATSSDVLYTTTNESEYDDDHSHSSEKSCIEKSVFNDDSESTKLSSDVPRLSSSQVSHTAKVCGSKYSSLVSTLKAVQEKVDNCETTGELAVIKAKETCTNIHKNEAIYDSTENTYSCAESTANRTYTVQTENHDNSLMHLSQLLPSACIHENTTRSEKCAQRSPNQEVFTFHNYSKETFNAFPNTMQNSGALPEHSVERQSVCESSQSDTTFADGADYGIEVDKCVASVDDPLDQDNLDLVLQDFNIIKIEEESIPISKKHEETDSGLDSLKCFVKQHSDVIISQQLNKERVAPPCANNDSPKPSKTTLRLLQLQDGKPPVLLRATENQIAMPVQLKATPGFKLITNSVSPQINVSYMKPGFERLSSAAGATPTSNRKVGVMAVKSAAVKKGTTLYSTVPPSVGTSTNHYLINSPGLKGPVFLSSTPQNTPTDNTGKTQPTCYLLQRSVQLGQKPSTSHLKLKNTQLSLNSRPVLAMPVNTTVKTSALQNGRQAFLLRYISPPKSGQLPNNQEAKTGTQCSQTSDSCGGKVIFKIVSPSGSLLTSGAQTPSHQSLFMATRPQTQCFVVSSNKANSNAVKKFIHLQNSSKNDVNSSCSLLPRKNVKLQQCEVEKPILAPRPVRPPSQRKRRRKPLFDELPALAHKARRLSNKAPMEKETTALWNPVAKEVERTLRLSPFRLEQQIKCPRRYQPVVVLNHPDADIPEVANIMKTVSRYKGAVTKVALSQKTIQVLSELDLAERGSSTEATSCQLGCPWPRPLQSSVRERFLLKMKLRKKNKKKYEVVKNLSGYKQQLFSCWFCGRLFNSQEDWIGHGQRHLMEATRDWNKLF